MQGRTSCTMQWLLPGPPLHQLPCLWDVSAALLLQLPRAKPAHGSKHKRMSASTLTLSHWLLLSKSLTQQLHIGLNKHINIDMCADTSHQYTEETMYGTRHIVVSDACQNAGVNELHSGASSHTADARITAMSIYMVTECEYDGHKP